MFSQDLKFGNKYELIAQEYYKNNGYNILDTSLNKGCFKFYDFIVNKDNITHFIEVKADRLAYKTGNICIEYECNNKPSGINATKSNYYVYYIICNNEYKMYIIPVEIIKLYIDNNKYFKKVKGVERNKNSMYLFKIDMFKDYLIE